MLHPSDDLVLNGLSQLHKVGATTRYPRDQVSLVLRVLLCLQQGLPVDNIKLDVYCLG
jgi:hypothetical protein